MKKYAYELKAGDAIQLFGDSKWYRILKVDDDWSAKGEDKVYLALEGYGKKIVKKMALLEVR